MLQPHPQIVLENQSPSWKAWGPRLPRAAFATLLVLAVPSVASATGAERVRRTGTVRVTNGETSGETSALQVDATPAELLTDPDEATDEELAAIRAAEAEEAAFLRRHSAGVEEEYAAQRAAREFARE